MGNDLLMNIEIHTTKLGADRIKKNLGLDIADVIAWSKQKIKNASHTNQKGKKWYVYVDDFVLTINAHSYTIITATKRNKKKSQHSMKNMGTMQTSTTLIKTS